MGSQKGARSSQGQGQTSSTTGRRTQLERGRDPFLRERAPSQSPERTPDRGNQEGLERKGGQLSRR